MSYKELQAAVTPYFFIFPLGVFLMGAGAVRLVDTGRGQKP